MRKREREKRREGKGGEDARTAPTSVGHPSRADITWRVQCRHFAVPLQDFSSGPCLDLPCACCFFFNLTDAPSLRSFAAPTSTALKCQ